MTSIESSTREQAIAWWNNLSPYDEQHSLREKYFGYERLTSSLTGREIEEIWKNENSFMNTGLTQSEFISNCEKYFGGKSNQKQLIVEIMEEDSKDGLYDIPLQECVNCNEQKQVHSMCLDCCIKLGNQNQTEISDEEIEKIINPNKLDKIPESWKSFIDGAKWYREQLKKK